MNSVAQLKKLLSDSKEELLRSLDQSEKAIISLIQKNAEPEELPVKRSATKSRLRKLTRGGESIQKKPKREEAPRHEPIPKKAKHDETSEESASSDEESENLFDTESEPEVQSKPAVKEVKEPEPEEVNYSRKPRTTETVNALVQELKGAPESRAKILLDQLNLLISTNFDKNCLNLLASTKLVPTLTALGKERPGLKDKVDYMRTNWRNRSASLTGGVENWGLMRRFISWGGSLYARTILRVPVRDLTGGFNGFRREVLETIDRANVGSTGYCFQIELKYRSLKRGFKVVEKPIVFPDRIHGVSKMSGSIFMEAVVQVWRLRSLKIKKLPEKTS